MRTLLAILALFSTPAAAQISNPAIIDLSGYATSSALNAAVAAIPVPASTVPVAETVGGAAGSTMTFRRGDAVQPRITRAASCTLDAGGACTVTWATALPTAPTIVITPVNPAGAQAFICNTTGTPSTTSAAIKCWTTQTTLLSLAIVTTGLNLVPAAIAPAGTVVQVIAIPPTQ